MNNNWFISFIENALNEDLGDGDHSSLASIPAGSAGTAQLIIKEAGIIAGLDISRELFRYVDKDLQVDYTLQDGDRVKPGDIGFTLAGDLHTILKCERLVLNILQRMSGIATNTRRYVEAVEGTGARILDTRKTTPGIRVLEKMAVKIGGGTNHRMGLYDMIMLKDNHIDFAGGIKEAVRKTNRYLSRTGKSLPIEVEARGLQDVREILRIGNVHRIMLDNFSIPDTRKAVALIAGRYETESSGQITLENLRDSGSRA